MRLIILAVFTLLHLSCAHATRAPLVVSCDIGTLVPSTDTSALVKALTGTFALTRDDLHDPSKPTDETSLVFAPASDEARSKALLRQVGNRPRELWLSGSWQWSDEYPPFAAEVLSDLRIVLGCALCLDGSPTYLYVDRAGENGFAGVWVNFMTGNTINVDDKGRRLPVPEGAFCAVRSGRDTSHASRPFPGTLPE